MSPRRHPLCCSLDRDHGYPADRDPSITPALQGGANVGLVVFP